MSARSKYKLHKLWIDKLRVSFYCDITAVFVYPLSCVWMRLVLEAYTPFYREPENLSERLRCS